MSISGRVNPEQNPGFWAQKSLRGLHPGQVMSYVLIIKGRHPNGLEKEKPTVTPPKFNIAPENGGFQ